MVDLVPDIIKSAVARTGPPGSAGNQIFSGAGAPANPYPGAYDGDWYLNTTTNVITPLTGPVSPNGGSSAIAAINARIDAINNLVVPVTKGIRTGRLYGPLETLSGWDALTTWGPGAYFINAAPFQWAIDALLVGARVNVTTAQAGGTIRMGIYAFGATGVPDELVLDFGTIDCSATGDRNSAPVNVTLPRGSYWIGGATNIAGIQFKAALSGPGVSSVLGHVDTTGTTSRASCFKTVSLGSGFTALPATFGAVTTNFVIPGFWLVAG